ncbi:hypothetical protein HOI83_01120 [Candidatus Uhrbacteria bacterium]|jgi:hypothetical protein|nr:hypothetical protein [Candidatus Uhrbacteria bacterium]
MNKEYEFKYDIPVEIGINSVCSAIGAFTDEITSEDNVEVVHKENKFVFIDDAGLSLLNRGDTLRRVHFETKEGKRHHNTPRCDYKSGAVNSKDRKENSYFEPRGDIAPWQMAQKLDVDVAGELSEVATVFTSHWQYDVTIGTVRVEISYDRFYRDEARTSLIFQEVEIELKEGAEADFENVSMMFAQSISRRFVVKLSRIQKYARVMREFCPTDALMVAVNHAFSVHRDESLKLSNSLRRHDGLSPYAIHPCWCALTILQEPLLPHQLRWDGAIALALHDVLEDTTAKLPEGTTPSVAKLVDEMTFESYGEELNSWWKISREAQLLKLYDKVSNLLDGTWMHDEKAAMYKFYTLRLAGIANKHYGDLNIVRIARAICA